jgi:hypothetical protein
MTEGSESVKAEILDRFEQKLEQNAEIPAEVVSLLKRDYNHDDFGEDEELQEAIERIVAYKARSEP